MDCNSYKREQTVLFVILKYRDAMVRITGLPVTGADRLVSYCFLSKLAAITDAMGGYESKRMKLYMLGYLYP